MIKSIILFATAFALLSDASGMNPQLPQQQQLLQNKNQRFSELRSVSNIAGIASFIKDLKSPDEKIEFFLMLNLEEHVECLSIMNYDDALVIAGHLDSWCDRRMAAYNKLDAPKSLEEVVNSELWSKLSDERRAEIMAFLREQEKVAALKKSLAGLMEEKKERIELEEKLKKLEAHTLSDEEKSALFYKSIGLLLKK
jgi:hypothetical protein